MGASMEVDIQQAREFLRRKEARRQERLEARFQQAWADFRAIVDLAVRTYRPARLYQWGSLLERRHFCEGSSLSETAPIQVLISELEKRRTVLARIDAFYRDYLARTEGARARLTEQAIVIANSLSGWYTCLETQFLRISRFFENSLVADCWDQDLLEKMTLDLPNIRPAVIQSDTAALLGELLRFRHFHRYYFDLTYDWDRLDLVQRKYAQVQPLLSRDLDAFRNFLQRLAGSD